MKYTTIFLDLDDTLIDTTGNTRRTLNEIYDDYNISRYYDTFEEFRETYETKNNYLWELFSQDKIEKPVLLKKRFYHLFEDFPEVTEAWVDKMNKDFLHRVERKSGHIDGAIEFLDYLKGKYKKLYIISNGFNDTQLVKIQSAGMEEYFDELIFSDTVGISKPSAEIFEFALKQVGAKPEDSAMIGDNIITDIKGAQGVGMTTIWFNPNGNDDDGVKPDYTITKLCEIRNIL